MLKKLFRFLFPQNFISERDRARFNQLEKDRVSYIEQINNLKEQNYLLNNEINEQNDREESLIKELNNRCEMDRELASNKENMLFLNGDDRVNLDLINFKAELDSRKYAPNDEQNEMIYSPDRNVCVIAGAGSGKSTTLIQRIAFLIKVLRVPLREITVFSFTRASVIDFRAKLGKELEKQDIPFEKNDLKNVVTTFHSKILKFSPTSKKAFEFLEQGAEDEMFVDMFGGKLNPTQISYLNRAYLFAYKNNGEFKKIVDRFYIENIIHINSIRPNGFERQEWVVNQTLARDKVIADYINENFLGGEFGPIEIPLRDNNRSEICVYPNYMQTLNGEDIYFFFDPILADDQKSECISYTDYSKKEQKIELSKALTLRKLCLINKTDKRFHFIKSKEKFRDLSQLENFISKRESKYPPEIVIPSSKGKGIRFEEELFNQISFFNNMGIHPEDILNNINNHEMTTRNCLLIKAAAIFRDIFYGYLSKNDLFTFDNLFLDNSINNKDSLRLMDTRLLSTMKHLMIDEFQDISPLIARWIQGVKEEIQKRDVFKSDRGSLMVVGDDYQSIYGWRGSSPDFFINYARHFPYFAPTSIMLNTNYRSIQQIIDDGEKVLESISGQFKIKKHGVADKIGSGKQLQAKICNEVEGLENDPIVQEYIRQKGGATRKLFILSRSNEALNKARDFLGKQGLTEKKDYSAYTFHGSKGLEADDVILIDDCFYRGPDEIKNFIHVLASQAQSYDDAQLDEAKRLAYVAITRAKERVSWIGTKQSNGVMQLF